MCVDQHYMGTTGLNSGLNFDNTSILISITFDRQNPGGTIGIFSEWKVFQEMKSLRLYVQYDGQLTITTTMNQPERYKFKTGSEYAIFFSWK